MHNLNKMHMKLFASIFSIQFTELVILSGELRKKRMGELRRKESGGVVRTVRS